MNEYEDIEEEEENDDEIRKEEENFEKLINKKVDDNTWQLGGVKKSEVLRVLIKCFGSMIESAPKDFALPDHHGVYRQIDMLHHKLIDAAKYVSRAKSVLLTHENFDTRDFTLFVSRKLWVKTIIRPLLELCAKDDYSLAIRCCSLCLILIRRPSDNTLKMLRSDHKKRRKSNRGEDSIDIERNDQPMKITDGELRVNKFHNAKDQIIALLTFKEALCSEKCNEAVFNAFREFWVKEQQEPDEENKIAVAICFSYFRRLLAIETNPIYSTAGEIIQNSHIHHLYIIQLRQILSVLPGICSDLMKEYHNDWLGDIILLIYHSLQGFNPTELFDIWKTSSLIEDFQDIHSWLGAKKFDQHVEDIDTKNEKKSSRESIVLETDGARNGTVPLEIRPVQKLGILSKLLKRERDDRNRKILSSSSASVLSRAGRFRGVFSIQKGCDDPVSKENIENGPLLSNHATPVTKVHTTSLGTSTTEKSKLDDLISPIKQTRRDAIVCEHHDRIIRKDPSRSQEAALLPQVQLRRNKRNIPYTTDSLTEDILAVHGQSEIFGESIYGGNAIQLHDRKRACMINATLVHFLSQDIALKSLVKKVNQDLRSDMMKIGPELEVKYFEVLYKILHYNRLKLEYQHNEYEMNRVKLNGISKWEPNLLNIMDSLDKMSFTRVLFCIERLLKDESKWEEVYIPIMLYKEMICYLRILLMSDIDGHHEISIATLYRIFYTSSERQDPLLKLLQDWRPGSFPRRHFYILIELLHETLRTLDLAKNHIKDEQRKHDLMMLALKAGKKREKNSLDFEHYLISCVKFNVDDYFAKLVTNQTVRMHSILLLNYEGHDSSYNEMIYLFYQRMWSYRLEQEYYAPSPTGKGNLSTGSEPGHVTLGFMLFNLHTLTIFSRVLNDPHLHDAHNAHMRKLIDLMKATVRRFGEAVAKNHLLYVELLFQHARAHEFCCVVDSVYNASAYASIHSHEDETNPSTSNGLLRKMDDYGDELEDTEMITFSKPVDISVDDSSDVMNLDEVMDQLPKRRHSRLRIQRGSWSKEEDTLLKKEFEAHAGDRNIFDLISNSDRWRAFGKKRDAIEIEKRVIDLKLHLNIELSDEDDEMADVDGNKKIDEVLNMDYEAESSRQLTSKWSDDDEEDEELIGEENWGVSQGEKKNTSAEKVPLENSDKSDDIKEVRVKKSKLTLSNQKSDRNQSTDSDEDLITQEEESTVPINTMNPLKSRNMRIALEDEE